MGASTVVAHLLMFITVLGMATAAIMVLTDYVSKTSTAVNEKQKDMVSQLKTNIDITNINSPSNTTSLIYVKNLGSTQLRTSCMDLFIDNDWVDYSNFTKVDPTTKTNVTLLQEDVTLLINASHGELASGETHEIRVVTCNGISDDYMFSL